MKENFEKLKKSTEILNEVVTDHESRLRTTEYDVDKHKQAIERIEKVNKYQAKQIDDLERKTRDLEMQIDKNKGISYQEIADKNGLSKSRVGQILKNK